MTRNGKIARLPHHIRTELNERLRDGEGGQELLDWVNGLKETKKLVAEKFKGVPVHANNLSEWREGGYAEWLKQQETLALAREIAERAADFLEETNRDFSEFHENLSAVLALEVAASAKVLLEGAKDPEERWKHLRGVIKQATVLRRSDQRATATRIKEEQWGFKSAHMAEEHRMSAGIRNFADVYLNVERSRLNRDKQAFEERKANMNPKQEGGN